jgi:Putative glycosyl/glycerophosphate transferases involved in teichoic acid biosynthesis TagF/TagB/EpsJ/RodC
MKDKLIRLLKNNKVLYKIYYFCGSTFLYFVSIFVRTDNKLIIFNSFGGKKYDDSPKEIHEKIIKDSRFNDYKIIWAFHSPNLLNVDGAKSIKTDTIKYFYYTLKAKCWITNSTIERALRYKNKNTFYFNTWHGTPIKKMGTDIEKDKRFLDAGEKVKWKVDLMCAQGVYDATIFSRAFNIDYDKFVISGLPRNDILANYNDNYKQQLKIKLNIPLNKKVILYAPTFREFDKDKKLNCVIKPPIDFEKWKSEISDEYILLLRAHYEVSKILNIKTDDFLYDFSDYECLNDLMVVSDILISDYSSIYFDYSVMGKPMLCFAYDYDKYMENRGMYIDIREEFPCEIAYDESALLDQILNLDYEKMSSATIQFRDKYIEEYGNATNICVDKIWENIKE